MKRGWETVLAGLSLLAFAGGCDGKPPAPPPGAAPTAAAAPADPSEAKRLKLAGIIREILESGKGPEAPEDPARQEEVRKLSEEARDIARQLAGDDRKKQEALAEEVVKKYLPDHYRKRQIVQAKVHMRAIGQALDAFELDTARFPATEQGLRALVEKPASDSWRGPYFSAVIPKDPWGSDYVYRFPGTKDPRSYDLKSRGPDGREGTPDDVEN